MPTLSTYLSRTRRLLTDSNSTYYSDAELTDCINVGRKRVALDTACLRSLEEVTLTDGTESYAIPTSTSKLARCIDVLNIVVDWGNQRVPLIQMVWSEFSANLRVWQNFENMPAAYSKYGAPLGSIYIGPVPNQNYTSRWDIIYIPADLVDGSSTDELAYPYDDPVPYYAAYTAKYRQQSYGEAALYEQQYRQKAAWAISSTYTRILPSVYSYPQSW